MNVKNNSIVEKSSFFDFGVSCTKLGVTENCGIISDGDGNILSLGPWQRGTFEPRIDIAGPGVLLAFLLTSIFFTIGGFIAFYKSWRNVGKGWESHRPLATERQGAKKIFYKAFRTYLLATLDTQMLLMFGYGLNFSLIQRCTISSYHYTIVTEIGLIACANIVLTTAFVSEYWKAPITGALRLGAMLTIFAFLGFVLNHQRTRIETPEYIPSSDRKDSAILLPASCFLDSQFAHIYSKLTTSERDKVGYPMKSYQFWEFPLWIVLLIVLVAGIGRGIMQLRSDRSMRANTYSLWKGVIMCLYKAVALILFTIMTVIAWSRIYLFRKWVAHSGWMKPGRISNPADDWLENGQILPMLQLVVIGIFIFNEYELKFYSSNPKTSSPQSDIELTDMNSQS